MIIDFFKDSSGRIFTGLPDTYCPNSEVCVSYLRIKLDEAIPDSFVTLSTTMVDKCPRNPKQQVVSYFNSSYIGQSNELVYQPTQFAWYKILSPNISDSFFELHLDSEHQSVKIEKIYIQLSIRKLCKDSAAH